MVHDTKDHAVPPIESPAARKLRIATTLQAKGQTRHAIDVWFEVLESEPTSPQAREAAAKLLGIAQSYEAEGAIRQAMALYERLDEAQPPVEPPPAELPPAG